MLKQKINDDFIAAFKSGRIEEKTTLGMIKTKISEAEKKDGKELDDIQIMNVIQSYGKQIEQTIQAIGPHPDGSAHVLLVKAEREKELVQRYLPKVMTKEEIKRKLDDMIMGEVYPSEEKRKVFGQLMKRFRDKYPNQYDSTVLKTVIEETLGL